MFNPLARPSERPVLRAFDPTEHLATVQTATALLASPRIRAALVCTLACLACLACGDDTATPDAGPNDDDAGTDAGGGAVRQLDRSSFANVSLEGRLDYDTAEHWLCRPDIEPNECMRNLDATEIKPDGTFEVQAHTPAAEPAFDCFYVYPTMWLNRTAHMTDFSDEGVRLVLDALVTQAARWTRLCRVFAPMYRQVGIINSLPAPDADKELALQDVRDAFAHYLENDSRGRKFVLLGHSQGSFMLTSLIIRDIDENPALRSRMISAVLLGALPYAPPGETVGGAFKNVPACTQKGETGCVIAYNSFAKEAPPGENAAFGKLGTAAALANEPVDPNGELLCVEPLGLTDNGPRYSGSYFPLMLNNPQFGAPRVIPGVDTPFVVLRDMFRGECVRRDEFHYLEISADQPEGDVRTLPDYRNPFLEQLGFGLHLVDYNIPLEDLMAAVELQADRALD